MSDYKTPRHYHADAVARQNKVVKRFAGAWLALFALGFVAVAVAIWAVIMLVLHFT